MTMHLKSIEESFFSIPGLFTLGPSVRRCPLKDMPGYGDLLMSVDAFDGSDSNTGVHLLRSRDNGETWTEQEVLEKSYVCDFNGGEMKCGYGGLCVDEITGVLILFSSELLARNGDINNGKRFRRIFYRLSFDNGFTWTDKRMIVQQGRDEKGVPYDRNHFMSGVTYGVNMAANISPIELRADDGSLLVGVQMQAVDEQGALVEPSGFMFLKCGALKAFWNAKKADYDWQFGQWVQVDWHMSTRGVYEPTFARLGENSVLMVMRGSNMRFRDSIDGQKFFSVSHDNGLTWTEPRPLAYDDGGTMYSSSCIPKLLCHSSGRVFFVGVICNENPDGNLPRWPLCIAEINMATMTIRRDSVLYIDGRRDFHKKAQEEAAKTGQRLNHIDYSNHTVYEDDEGNIVVLAPFRFDLSKWENVLNRYVIAVD